jgi:hypothetical protein
MDWRQLGMAFALIGWPCGEHKLECLQGGRSQTHPITGSRPQVFRRGWLAGILGLTKMDWNNNTLYKKLPVTLVYSKAFADIIQQNPNIEAITSAHSPT